ncbi:adipocyte plasma membrane-associated protein-like isoform X2 [Apostichopus japonicus]|uniref:adipocyte plasma membrane-associated protein-like isoform X2 n=1 Tax=Stichopus japonicus TaxID=307972 RepID=UPI003AB5EDC9
MSDDSKVRQRKGVEEISPKAGTTGSSSKNPQTPWQSRLRKRPPTCWEQFGKYFWWLLYLGILIIIIGIVVVLRMDSPIKPRFLQLPTPRPLTGALEPNNVLQKAKRLFEGEIIGPESLVLLEGKIYTGTYDGKIVRLENDNKLTVIAKLGEEPCGTPENEHTCGRPLGLQVSEHGTLYVIDAYLGVYEVNVTGEFTQLVPASRTYMGHSIRFGNDVTRLPGGDFFFTDSDFKWERREFPYIMIETSPNGRLMWFNPKTRFSNVALFDLYFPNGIQISPDQQFMLICESSAYRILKYYIQGDKAGNKEIFVDNLPGLPDNIRPSKSGGYWVGIHFAALRNGPYPIADFLGMRPMLRKQLMKLFSPHFLLQYLPKHGMIIELSKDGEIIRSFHDPTGEVIDSVSEVLDTGDALYLGSYKAPYLAKLNYKDIPAKVVGQ